MIKRSNEDAKVRLILQSTVAAARQLVPIHIHQSTDGKLSQIIEHPGFLPAGPERAVGIPETLFLDLQPLLVVEFCVDGLALGVQDLEPGGVDLGVLGRRDDAVQPAYLKAVPLSSMSSRSSRMSSSREQTIWPQQRVVRLESRSNLRKFIKNYKIHESCFKFRKGNFVVKVDISGFEHHDPVGVVVEVAAVEGADLGGPGLAHAVDLVQKLVVDHARLGLM